MEPQQQPQQQQVDVKDLFAIIGELTVQLRVTNQILTQLQQEKAEGYSSNSIHKGDE